ncbi:MAG: LPS export ABC transporter permease LptG, partial [bacterium]
YELFPMAALLGAIIGLSLLANDSELIVMRASGVSLWRIAAATLKTGAWFVLAAIVIGEGVAPSAESHAQRGRAEALQQSIHRPTDGGLWLRDDRTYINVGAVLPDLTLLRIKLFEFDADNNLRALVAAEDGRFDADDSRGGKWTLNNVEETRFRWAGGGAGGGGDVDDDASGDGGDDADDGVDDANDGVGDAGDSGGDDASDGIGDGAIDDARNITSNDATARADDDFGDAETAHHATREWRSDVTPQLLSALLLQPDQLSLRQLHRHIRHLERNQQQTAPHELAFWSKLMLPLSTAVMVVLAIPFVFTNLRSGALGRNLFAGIMLGLGFYATTKIFGYFVLAFALPPLLGATAPLVVFLGLAGWMMGRVE